MAEPKANAEKKSTPAKPSRRARPANLDHRTYYFNRELSWLQFNARVLEEALDQTTPLLERVKFLSIFFSNLDEFFMIRVSGLRRQHAGGALVAPPDGMSPAQQLTAIYDRLEPQLDEAARCWAKDLQPRLTEAGINVLPYEQLKSKQRKLLRKMFKRELFPVLTPLASDPSHPFPHISNLSVNLAVVVNDPKQGERFARVKVPHMFPRLIRVPSEEKADPQTLLGLEDSRYSNFVWLEEVVAANLDTLFPGLKVEAAYPFRVTRDADFEIEEDEASDLLDAMEEVVGQRFFGSAVRLEVDSGMPQRYREVLVENLDLAPYQVYSVDGPIGQSDLMGLMSIDRPDLKDKPFKPVQPRALAGEESIFSILKRRNILLYHPYDSFAPVVDFVREAARDRHVLAIKQTLYRVGPNSPIVAALQEARENGKQVSVLVELKARFDEENNIVWARALERAGVHVVYGLLGLKTHAKVCLVVRREPEGLMRYLHMGTGNYNPVTARMYTDLGYLTADPELAADASHLFNSLTGYSAEDRYDKLLVAPGEMRALLLARIQREVARHREEGGGGHIAFKMNSLVDKACIKALYQASMAGVKVDLQVRGICCLKPGVKRVSENISVTSVVGRFLEHPRIYYFRNGGDDEILLGSADLMPRNLDGRVETLFPVTDERIKAAIRDDILFRHLADNVQSRRLLPSGDYERLAVAEGDRPLDSQAELLEEPGSWHFDE